MQHPEKKFLQNPPRKSRPGHITLGIACAGQKLQNKVLPGKTWGMQLIPTIHHADFLTEPEL